MVVNEVREVKRSLICIDMSNLLLIRLLFNNTLFPTSMGEYTSFPQFFLTWQCNWHCDQVNMLFRFPSKKTALGSVFWPRASSVVSDLSPYFLLQAVLSQWLSIAWALVPMGFCRMLTFPHWSSWNFLRTDLRFSLPVYSSFSFTLYNCYACTATLHWKFFLPTIPPSPLSFTGLPPLNLLYV